MARCPFAKKNRGENTETKKLTVGESVTAVCENTAGRGRAAECIIGILATFSYCRPAIEKARLRIRLRASQDQLSIKLR